MQVRASKPKIENPLSPVAPPKFRPYPEYFEGCKTLQDFAAAAREAELRWIAEHRPKSKWPPALEPRNAKR
jgi:hypothetical protein